MQPAPDHGIVSVERRTTHLREPATYHPATVKDLDEDSDLDEDHLDTPEGEWEPDTLDFFDEMTDLAEFAVLQSKIASLNSKN